MQFHSVDVLQKYIVIMLEATYFDLIVNNYTPEKK